MDELTRQMVRLTMIPGLGPVLIARAVKALGSAEAVLGASETALRGIPGFGPKTARTVAAGMEESAGRAEEELGAAERLGVTIIAMRTAAYPPLLAQIPDAPPVLYVLGKLEAGGGGGAESYPVAIVGSRSCTPYGVEQAERFGLHLAQAGLTVVSGGARGIDTAAHRGALRAGSAEAAGLTVAVLGCGLAHRYPPDNTELFEKIVAAGGALVSELPLNTPPVAENFPARNRIISGLCLGVIVIEAGRKSGALITARQAAEDHGREVFAVPGRVDSTASEGTLDLLKAGGAALVTHPTDVIEALEGPARHYFVGTHAERFGVGNAPDGLFDGAEEGASTAAGVPPRDRAPLHRDGGRDARPTARESTVGMSEAQRAILGALEEPATMDELARLTGLEPGKLRAELTMLEIGRRVKREGTRVARV